MRKRTGVSRHDRTEGQELNQEPVLGKSAYGPEKFRVTEHREKKIKNNNQKPNNKHNRLQNKRQSRCK